MIFLEIGVKRLAYFVEEFLKINIAFFFVIIFSGIELVKIP